MCKLYFAICIYIIFYFQPVVQTYKIYQLDPDARNELLPKIQQILAAQRNEPKFQKVHNIKKEKRKPPRFKPIGNSVFVKRIIPHGYEGGKYEYDEKLNTVYKPLVRYHVKKPVDQHERRIVKEIESDYNLKNRFDEGVIVLVKKDRRNPQELLRKIQDFLKNSARQEKAKNRWSKKRFRGLSRLDESKADNRLLRIMDKSGEIHDPYAPGKIPVNLVQEEAISSSKEESSKFTLPNYPFYNYWTYQKNVIQDLCPGNTVQMGNMCVNVTGHRKSLSIKDAIKSSKPMRKSYF